MSILKRNIISNTLLSLSQILFPLITFPYAARILGPTGVGQVSFADSLTQYFILFAAVGIPLYGVREMAKLRNNPAGSNHLFSEIISLHFVTTLGFLVVYFITILLLKPDGVEHNLYIIGGGLIICNVFIIEWYYQSQEKFSYIAKRTVLLRFFFIFLMFALVKTKDDLIKYYFLFFVLQFLNASVNFYLVFKSGIKMTFKSLDLRKHIKPLLFLTACSVIGSVYVLLDNVILGLLSTSTSVGYYSAAIKITKVPISLINALGIVLVPKLSESFSNNDLTTVRYYIDSSIHYVLTLGIPLGIGIALTAKWTVLLISGQEFYPAIQLVQILSPIVLLIALNCIYFFQLFTPGNKEKIMIYILASSACISIILNIILIPIMQHVGAAITTTLTELSVFLISLYFSKRLFNIGLKYSAFISPIISSLIFMPVVYFIDLTNYNVGIKLCAGGSICMLFYFLLQRFLFKDEIIMKMQNFILSVIHPNKTV